MRGAILCSTVVEGSSIGALLSLCLLSFSVISLDFHIISQIRNAENEDVALVFNILKADSCVRSAIAGVDSSRQRTFSNVIRVFLSSTLQVRYSVLLLFSQMDGMQCVTFHEFDVAEANCRQLWLQIRSWKEHSFLRKTNDICMTGDKVKRSTKNREAQGDQNICSN